jgi:hypothetical protein
MVLYGFVWFCMVLLMYYLWFYNIRVTCSNIMIRYNQIGLLIYIYNYIYIQYMLICHVGPLATKLLMKERLCCHGRKHAIRL